MERLGWSSDSESNAVRNFNFFVGPPLAVRLKSRTMTDRDQPQTPQLRNKGVTITTNHSRCSREWRELRMTGVQQNRPFEIIKVHCSFINGFCMPYSICLTEEGNDMNYVNHFPVSPDPPQTNSRHYFTLISFHLQPNFLKPNGDSEWMMGEGFGENGSF